jgi:DNA invertase Pin-like site-specific DNA recombinase
LVLEDDEIDEPSLLHPGLYGGPSQVWSGLEAQRATIAQFAAAEGLEITREFVEVETGKGSDALARRPQLAAALAAAKKLKCAVVVAKLDRLARDVSFIGNTSIGT